MTPKEKAIELLEKMLNGFQFNIDEYTAKKNALIAVDEILKIVPSVYVTKDEEIHNGHYQYWQEVKQEIERL